VVGRTPERPAEVTAEPVLLSIGAVADRLGVAPGTVRSWGRRHGPIPAGHTTGGHRRFTLADLAAMVQM
jgi:DNA-binding transcriptional MerR regulator